MPSLLVQPRYCAAPSWGSARLTDVIGESLTYIGIPLSLCQREEGGGHRASQFTVQKEPVHCSEAAVSAVCSGGWSRSINLKFELESMVFIRLSLQD